VSNSIATGLPETVIPLDPRFAVPAGRARLDRAAAALRERGFIAEVVTSLSEARDRVLSLLPSDGSVFTALSETLRLSGIAEAIDESGRFRSVRAELSESDPTKRFIELIQVGATPDVVVGSVHAVTEDGQLLIASGSGSQLGPYAAGARQAIWVVGAQKVVPDLTTAFERVHRYSYPLEDARFRRAAGLPSSVAKLLLIEREMPGRGTVILVEQPVGF
jgi:LUD domain